MGGRVRICSMRDLDRVAALWTEITKHHELLDPVFRMRSNVDSELSELLRTLQRD